MDLPAASTPVAITLGDPAGIGPEIVARLFAEGTSVPCLVFGDRGALRRAAESLGVAVPASVRQVGPDLPPIVPGKVSAIAGAASHAYLLAAIDAALARKVRGIVTAPISKEAWHAAGILSPGHTEVLAERTSTADYAMMMANDELRVLLVSIHLSLADAVRAVTFEAELRAIRLAFRACREAGIAAPRVAVAGLNPHAGEAGMFGDEEQRIIAPAITAARAEGIDASGPWPGDTVFSRARVGKFDIVVAQYHDQGLIPVKYLGIERGVNVTVGLPFVRTSVDHGTAFDIAGTGRASAASLRAALDMAVRLAAGARSAVTAASALPTDPTAFP